MAKKSFKISLSKGFILSTFKSNTFNYLLLSFQDFIFFKILPLSRILSFPKVLSLFKILTLLYLLFNKF